MGYAVAKTEHSAGISYAISKGNSTNAPTAVNPPRIMPSSGSGVVVDGVWMVVAKLVWVVVIAVVITGGCAVVEGVSLTEGGADVKAVLLWQAAKITETSKSKKPNTKPVPWKARPLHLCSASEPSIWPRPMQSRTFPWENLPPMLAIS